jgi:GAF domain-containing protein
LHIIDAETKTRIESPALRRLRNGSTFGSSSQKILIGKDGAERFIDDSAAPIRDAQRGVLGTVLVFRDITARRRAEESLRFLAESGTILSSSLNYDATLKNVARLACNAISDYCFFDLMTKDGGVKRVAWAHKDPAKLAKMGDIWRFVPAKEFKHDPVIKTISTGKTEFVPRVDDRWMRNSTTGPDYYQYMRELECCSFMAVPVAVKGRTLGALSFCLTAASKRYFTDPDRTLAEELGRRAGLAVQNASLHQQLRQSAEELRQADRRKDDFLAVLAHELRNPLAPLNHGLQIIRQGVNGSYAVEAAYQMMERQLA